MQLVNEQDNVSSAADFLQYPIQALFEIAPVARASHKGAQVEGVDLFAQEGVGYLPGDNALSEALHDGGLADARLSDQDRAVLGAATEHLHNPLDLALAPDDRVELVHHCELGEVVAELVERSAAGRSLGADRDPRIPVPLGDGVA